MWCQFCLTFWLERFNGCFPSLFLLRKFDQYDCVLPILSCSFRMLFFVLDFFRWMFFFSPKQPQVPSRFIFVFQKNKPKKSAASRILFAVIGFAFVYTSPTMFFICYAISAFNDIADGYFARKYNQVSKLGAVLDMVTDRASTTCLIMVLCQLYPAYSFFFLTSVAMDIMSHFAHITRFFLFFFFHTWDLTGVAT